jgi:uncharacterized membrane protein YkoI
MSKPFHAAAAAAALAAALVGAGAGCRKDKSDDHVTVDRHPKPEGRMQVDQSAVLPVNVKAGVQREYPGAAVQEVNKRTLDDRVVRYEVQLVTKDGKQVTRVFDADGKPAK